MASRPAPDRRFDGRIQSFKFVPLALFPFGKEIVSARDLRNDLGIARAT